MKVRNKEVKDGRNQKRDLRRRTEPRRETRHQKVEHSIAGQKRQPGTSQEKAGSAANSKVKTTGHRKRDKTKGDKL